MAITLTSSFQNVATVTSPVMGANYGLRLYLRYVDSTVYYELRYYGYQSMGYKNLSAYLKEGGSTFKDLTADCYGGSTSSNAEWTWQNGSWNANNANQVYSQTLTFEGWACPSKDSARQTKEFTYTVPSRTVIPHNPVASISFDKVNYELNDKVTISWVEQEGGTTPDKYQVILHRNNTWRPEALLKAWVSNDMRSHTFDITLAEDGYVVGDALTVEVQSWFGEEAKVLYSGYGYTNDYPRVVAMPIPKVKLYNGYHSNVNAYLDPVVNYNNYSVAIGYRSCIDGVLGTVTWLPSEIFSDDYDKQVINLIPGTTYLFMGWAQATDGSTESPYSDDYWTEANCTKFIAGAPYIVNYNDVYESTETTISIAFSDIYNDPSLYNITGGCIGYREKGSSEIIWSPANWDDYAYAGTLYLSQTFTGLKPNTEYEFIGWAYSSTNNGAGTTYDDRDDWIVVKTQSTTAFISISINGNSFVKAPTYISVNGGEFKKITKEAFKVM